MSKSFKQFNPFYKLNSGLFDTEIFGEKRIFLRNEESRYTKFAACIQSFERNLIRLHHILNRIAEHLNITYGINDRKKAGRYKVQNTIALGLDVNMFIITVKVLLDNIAFFTPFYYKEPTIWGKKDARDRKYPWSFSQMKTHFIGNILSRDEDFLKILEKNSDWSDSVCGLRNSVLHKFHDLVINYDYWTDTYYAFLYNFNTKIDFIPDVLSYVARIYYKFVKFSKEYEHFFKTRCEKQFSSYEYFHKGYAVARALNKGHLFFGGLGRLIENKVLIKIHPNRRDKISTLLSKFLQEENIACGICHSYDFNVKPTVNEFVLISIKCSCGKPLSIPIIIEKKFFPHFMDPNDRPTFWGLIPYTLGQKMKREN